MTKAEQLDAALAVAHLPSALAAAAQLSGRADMLKPEWTPTYTPMAPEDIGHPPAVMDAMRAAVREVLLPYVEGRLPPSPPPPHALVRRAMDFVAGEPVPESYAGFVIDELALEGESSKSPKWAQETKAAAKRLKVLIVGAGMSGLLTAVRLSEVGVDFQIVEKNPDVGGTWLENTYPGCRVDCSNYVYAYSFDINADWPQQFSTQPVLLDYFQRIAERFGLRRKTRFGVEVTALDWDEGRHLWRATLKTAEGEEVLEADAVVSATGQLNRPSIPAIEGAERFAGPAFHTARWRHDVDLAGRRVAVIGTGASAYQAVPEIAPHVAHLDVYQRSPPWQVPAPHYHADVPDALRWLLRTVPAYADWYRFRVFWGSSEGLLPALAVQDGWTDGDRSVSAANADLRALLEGAALAQVADRPDLQPHVVPAYPPGSKRAVLDNGVWLGALKRDNVSLVTDPIREITAGGVVTQNGTERAADVLIWATGFQPSRFLTPIRITGRGGRRLKDRWDGDARAYLGMTIPEFPNLFMLYGPNTNIVVNGSITFFSECSVRYVVGALELLAATGSAAMEVREDVHDAFNARVDAANATMAWGVPYARSWYKNAAGRVSQNWPFSLLDYWRATLKPEAADFILTPLREAGSAAGRAPAAAVA